MKDEKMKKSVLSRRAQAVIELAVFGSVFIFIIGSIFQQGYSSILYQQGMLEPMRQALYESYSKTSQASGSDTSAYKYNQVSYMIVEDRLSPDVAKYGSIERRPVIKTGAGSMSKGLFYSFDFDEESGLIPVTIVMINGKRFDLTSAAKYTASVCFDGTSVTMSRGDSAPVSEKNRERLEREFKSQGAGHFLTVKVRGNSGWYSVGADWRWDYNRNGDFSDDLWNRADLIGRRSALALWQWGTADPFPSFAALSGGEAPSPVSADVNGDLTEESVYWAEADNGCYTLGVIDPAAGDISSEDAGDFADPDDVPGLKMDAAIYTQMEDGTVLEIRNGGAFIPGTNDLSMSVSKKRQLDVISRVWQLNRKMYKAENFIARNPAVEVACGNPSVLTAAGEGGCCMQDNQLKTCFDMSSRTLYIRSRIRDQRGRMWINKVEPGKLVF